jgi:hypothetical protein
MACRRFHRLSILRAAGIVLLAISGASCRESDVDQPASQSSPFVFPEETGEVGAATSGSQAPLPAFSFTEAGQTSGLSHTYHNGEQGKSIMVETLGGGAGWLDYDRDGRWDIYMNQGGDSTRPVNPQQPSDALFRSRGAGTFQEVTAGSRVAEFGYSQGVAVGDFDDDGFEDVYITNVAANTLWRNLGDGTFEEIASTAGVDDERWSSSAAWADIDLDGDLDLYVCNYLIYDPLNPLDCRTKEGKHRICHPKDLDPWPDECYMNQGDGTFTPEAKPRGLFGEGNKALGVAVADFNNDRLPDIYIANDTTANFLFINEGEGRFREQAHLLGCAADRNGSFQASMGLGIADVDGNGFLDIYSTHFHNESNTLYHNLGPQGFQDVTADVGLHAPTMPYLGFGTAIVDFNQDGRQEIFVANGHIENYPGNPLHKMRPQLLAFDGALWRDCGAAPGPYFEGKYVGRGVAACDYDEDGDLDLAVIHQNDPAALLRNDCRRGHWLKLEFRGRDSNRRGIGCRVIVRPQGARGEAGELMQELAGGTSYASSHQPVLIFGLGSQAGPCEVEVIWPSGRIQRLNELEVNRSIVVEEPAHELPK